MDFLADVTRVRRRWTPYRTLSLSRLSVMGRLRAKLADASQRSADLLARYNGRHPAVVNVEAEKRDIERGIAAETQRMAQTIKSEYALAKARQMRLNRQCGRRPAKAGWAMMMRCACASLNEQRQ